MRRSGFLDGPMKIAIVAKQFSRTGGGLEHYASSLVRGLASRGHEVHVYARTWDQPEEPGVHYCRVPSMKKPAWLQALTFHWGVNRVLAGQTFDIVLGSGVVLFYPQHLYRLSGGLVVEWLRRRYPVRGVRWAMMLARPVFLVNSWLERRLLSGRVRHVIANSIRYRNETVRHYGVPNDGITVIYNGCDPDRFHPDRSGHRRRAVRRQHDFPDEAVVLLFVAQNFKLKGLVATMEAMPAVLRKNPRVWLMVVGKDRPGRFQALARRLGIDRRVIFVGAKDDVEEYYVGADILVLPTQYDPFANVCLEAMACGLPVVTTQINGASELIQDGKNGYVISESTDTDMLSDRLCRLLDPVHRQAFGRAAAQTASRYTLEGHLVEMERLCDRIRTGERPARELRASLVPLSPEMTVHRKYQALLERHHLHTFEALMGYDEGTMLKDRKGKRVFQLRLEWKGEPVVLYLKRHRLPLSWRDRVRFGFGRPVVTEGGREWRNILAFHDGQVPTVVPVAMGERVRAGVQESFLVTRGLEEYESLERLGPKRFSPPLTTDLIAEKRALIRAIAELTTRMHWKRMCHRDYYLSHIFVRRGTSTTGALAPDIRFIDLQRVLIRPWFWSRWVIKDLAALNYSVHALGLTRTDKLRFLDAYHGTDSRDRSLMRAIQRKTDRIARHDRHRAVSA
ncbi:MAG: glycosyltransferase [Nitrospirae bacterium]|nr:glycosyltransferase [Nitrospirota bacterium]